MLHELSIIIFWRIWIKVWISIRVISSFYLSSLFRASDAMLASAWSLFDIMSLIDTAVLDRVISVLLNIV